MAGAISDVTQYWDAVVERWLAGESAVPDDLMSWFTSYRGTGDAAPDPEALPELWHGPLDPARCRVVFLSLNPGKVQPEFQHRDGIYAREIREEFGTYTAWAASWPYLREPWTASRHHSPKAHLPRRLTFARHWTGDPSLPSTAMVHFEMYPWHSTRLSAPLKPDRRIIERFVLNPIGEIGAPAFAFGKDWLTLLEHQLRLPVIDRLGVGGRDYGSEVPTRTVVVFERPDGGTIIAAKHNAPAGPPSRADAERLRNALSGVVT